MKHAQTALEDKSRTRLEGNRLGCSFCFAFALHASETPALQSEKRFIPLP
jgi:hypothetical protein